MDKLYFQWHITNLCNFHCRHCYQDSFDSINDLDWQGLKEIIERLVCFASKNNKKIVINITGGEPFLKKELFLLLDYLEQHDEIERFNIITNGSFLNSRNIKKLNQYQKLKEIKLSLEGATAQANDAIRDRGSFKKVWDAVHLIREESHIFPVVMFTVLKSNIKELPFLFNLAKEQMVSGVIIERFFPLGRGRQMKDQVLGYEDMYELHQQLLKVNSFSFDLEDLLIYRAFFIKFFSKETELLGAVCNVGKDSFCIMPNADVYPCRRFILKLGNLLNNSFEEIINSQLLKDITEAKRKGRCADCDIQLCRGCPAFSYLLNGDWSSEDTQCWYKR